MRWVKTLVFGILLSGCNQLIYSQNPASFLYENEFNLSFPVKDKWTMEAGLGNRGLLAEVDKGESSGYHHQHVEINHFTNYTSSEFLVFSIGLRYRLKEIFDASEVDEFRIIEQVKMESSNHLISLSHRFRLEQRFRENTVHRLRYELEFRKPFNEIFSWSVATETLISVSSQLKPEAEQRLSLGVENISFENMDLVFTFQYRLEDYARNPAHEFFIITGVNLKI